MSHHQDIYDNPSLSKKVFVNMKRVGTGFSEVITPLFKNMLVPAAKEVGQAQDDVSIPTEPSTSKPHKKHKSKKQQPIAPKVPSPKPSPEHTIPSPSNDPIPNADKDSLKFQELMDLCTRLSNKVLDLESEFIDLKALKEKSFKSAKIDTAAPVEDKEESFKQGRMIADMDEDVEDIDEEEPTEVEKVLEVVIAAKLITEVVTTAAQVPKVSALRRRRGVVIQDPEETAASVIVCTEVQPKDKGKGILIEEPKPLKGQAQIDMDEAFARQLEAELNANINWNDVVEQVKRSERPINAVMRPLFEKHCNSIQAFLEKVEEEVTVQEKEIKEEEATHLASKVHVVDYQIHHENNKPEDLETLWKLVKERFKTTGPKNFSDDFLLNTLKIMFEKPNFEASV
nr:hypothetical protein [Tanacetum cinerariifolium]